MKPPARACDAIRFAARRASAAVACSVLACGCTAYDHGAYERLIDVASAERAPHLDAGDAGLDVATEVGTDASPMDGAQPPSDVAQMDTAVPCVARRVSEYCTELPALPDAPVIDGVLDCGLALEAMPSAAFADMLGVSAQFAVAWRRDGLYVFVHVRELTRNPVPTSTPDSSLYCGDAVEVFVDSTGNLPASGAYNATGTAQLIVAAPADDSRNSTRLALRTATSGPGSTGTTWSSSTFVAFPNVDGYSVEALITDHDLDVAGLSLAAGQPVGLDLAVDFAAPLTDGGHACGGVNHEGQLVWHFQTAPCPSAGCHPSQDGLAFCMPRLDPAM